MNKILPKNNTEAPQMSRIDVHCGHTSSMSARGKKATASRAFAAAAPRTHEPVCAVSVKNGQLIFKTGKAGVTYILVTWQGHTARFEWCTE